MKRPVIVTALVSLAALSYSAVCAQDTEEAILREITRINAGETPTGVLLNQRGFANEAYILQVTDGTSGIKALQEGDDNQIRLMEAGSFVNINVSQQGTGNIYDGKIEGTDADIEINQVGAENSIMQSLQVTGAGISIMQNGRENEIIHTGNSTNPAMEIQQQGNGMKLIIQTN